MQSSGSRLLSLVKRQSVISPPVLKEDMKVSRGDFLTSSSPRHKKVYMKRLHMKVKDHPERTVTEDERTEMTTTSSPIIRPQRESESESILLDVLKLTSLASNSHE